MKNGKPVGLKRITACSVEAFAYLQRITSLFDMLSDTIRKRQWGDKFLIQWNSSALSRMVINDRSGPNLGKNLCCLEKTLLFEIFIYCITTTDSNDSQMNDGEE